MKDGGIVFRIHATRCDASCPLCRHHSERIHSRYHRTLLDLPWQGNAVLFELTCRKFFCDNRECRRRVFTEPLPAIAARYARKTSRLADALRELCYLVTGEAAARIARSFGLLVSADALLKELKELKELKQQASQRRAVHPRQTPRVLGIDDFAFRRGHSYGTILVDLECRCPVDLLPNREQETVAAWLQEHPGIEIISRDRGISYIEGVTRGAPNAVQVADRWHLLKNLGDCLERLLVCQHKLLKEQIRASGKPAQPNEQMTSASSSESQRLPIPMASTDAKVVSTARHERRTARFEEVKNLLNESHSEREIARRIGLSRNTVAKYARFAKAGSPPEPVIRPPRRSKITPFAGHLRRRGQEGCRNAAQLHEEIAAQGFTGTVSAVQRFVQSWREKPRCRLSGHHPPPLRLMPRQCSWLLTNPSHPQVTDKQRDFLKRLTESCPILASAQQLAQEFCRLIREHRGSNEFAAWLEQIYQSEVTELKSFARSLEPENGPGLLSTVPWKLRRSSSMTASSGLWLPDARAGHRMRPGLRYRRHRSAHGRSWEIPVSGRKRN